MLSVHGSSLDDSELLQQLVLQVLKVNAILGLLCCLVCGSDLIQFLQELRARDIDVKLETPKPPKKSLVPFSTPSQTPHSSHASQGRIFGRRLGDLSKLLVSLNDEQVGETVLITTASTPEYQETDVLVPKLVVSACKYIEENVQIEGIYRMSGSAARQKVANKLQCQNLLKVCF